MLLPGQEPVEEGWARAEAWGLGGGGGGQAQSDFLLPATAARLLLKSSPAGVAKLPALCCT